MYRIIFVLFVFFSLNVFGQKIDTKKLEENLSAHVHFLSDDKLEGRGTGSEGEKIAQAYIASHFAEYGVLPKGADGYLQAFTFNLGKKLTGQNYLMLNGESLNLGTAYFPLVYSTNGQIKAEVINVGFGIDAGELYNDYKDKNDLKGKVFAINLSSPDGIHPHSKYIDYTDYKTRVSTAQKYGAAAVIFFNDDKYVDDPRYNIKVKVQDLELPVVYVERAFASKLKENTKVELSVSMEKDIRTGKNVVGFIDNGAENTVVFGAHYDHLGWGKDGGSLHRGEPQIHNGADDNASGVSLILEISNYLAKQKDHNNNYLFICFSAEELGLIGSKSYLLDPTLDISKMNYMINMDMVGRLKPDSRKLAVGGVGTSPLFKTYAKSITDGNLNIQTKESGLGPSDHASFYLKDVPVLFFFTGTHKDYHKPSDDAWKINYKGMVSIFEYATGLIDKLDDHGKLEFVKTKEETKTSGKARFSVTLGVVPDYMFEGKGMRIDGITEGKPASNGGIQAGDVVTKMGDVNVTDMMAYMTALGKFKKGDTTIVEVVRNNELKRFNITF